MYYDGNLPYHECPMTLGKQKKMWLLNYFWGGEFRIFYQITKIRIFSLFDMKRMISFPCTAVALSTASAFNVVVENFGVTPRF